MKNVVSTDGFPIQRDMAVEAVVHHLRLAAMFFEALPDGNEFEMLKEELFRQKDLTEKPGIVPVWLNPACTWAALMHESYEKMKEND